MKLKPLTRCLLLFIITGLSPFVAQATHTTEPTPWEGAVIAVESSVLKNMHALAAKKKWDEAKAHLIVYQEIGSNPNAGEAIGKMLITKNKDGALAVIQLAQDELIQPHKGPITSTRQVKRAFVRAMQQFPKKQGPKSTLLATFFSIFSLEALTPSEKVTLHELERMVDEGLLKTSAILEKILAVIIEEVGILSPLDERNAPPSAPLSQVTES